MSTIPSPTEFYDACLKHDWYFEYSDDHSKWTAGNEVHRSLAELARLTPDLADIWREFHVWHFRKGRRPVRPGDEAPRLAEGQLDLFAG